MPRHHHVNLAVPPGGRDAQARFLLALGYAEVPLTAELAAMGADWWEDEHGQQIHLSVDDQHRPAAMAHTAVELGDAAATEQLLAGLGIDYRAIDRPEACIINCRDPSGNRWELRCPPRG